MNFKPLIIPIICFILGALVVFHFRSPEILTNIVHDIQTITVEKPVLDIRTVDRIIQDPKQKEQINVLLRENESLKSTVSQLTTSVASLRVVGGAEKGGVITPKPPEVPATGQAIPEDTIYAYRDYQLSATYSKSDFNYELDQKFYISTVTGKSKDGSPFSSVKLSQDTPNGPVDIPVKTTSIFADERVPRFLVSPRIQGGFSYDQDRKIGGVVALQWLKHGRSTAAEDLKWALLSPAGIFQGHKVTLGLLPVSFNLGSIKHNPFTNIWVSPTLDSSRRLGISLSATF